MKQVYFDNNLLPGVRAKTTREALVIALASGAQIRGTGGKKVNVDDAFDRTQHVGEGPSAFFVVSRPGAPRPDGADEHEMRILEANRRLGASAEAIERARKLLEGKP